MTRIFVTLAALTGAALLASFVLGVVYMPGAASADSGDSQRLVGVNPHWIVGMGSAILTLFTHCLIFTYFLGTGRWVKEVARAYGLPDDDMPKATREFKRAAFPPALFGMLMAIATAASGAAAQVMVAPWWLHMYLAIATLLVNGWAFMVEYRAVSANGRVMERIMSEVARRRAHEPVPAAGD